MWERRINKELMDLYRISSLIRSQRILWLDVSGLHTGRVSYISSTEVCGSTLSEIAPMLHTIFFLRPRLLKILKYNILTT